ncbi:MAG TPA: alpha-ketoglutarate-dependent dioxygenase AlkB [Gemmatimonadaceae bacterium]|nr:alpha-ketoglutarate-dependent dioxygenase AlkB [Gemmatimonadaceae bacterium]
MAKGQIDFFTETPKYPEGFRYEREIISRDEERALIDEIRTLPLKEFDFHGFLGKRRVKSFGWRYDYDDERLKEAEAIPDFILPLRERAAHFADLEPEQIQHVLFTEYDHAGIGWHRDKATFDDVIGVSLLAPCTFRLRRRVGAKWERISLEAEPRSAYLMRGPSRTQWEHSIPEVDGLRYSITFRTLRNS